jgi:hypothetical protein
MYKIDNEQEVQKRTHYKNSNSYETSINPYCQHEYGRICFQQATCSFPPLLISSTAYQLAADIVRFLERADYVGSLFPETTETSSAAFIVNLDVLEPRGSGFEA